MNIEKGDTVAIAGVGTFVAQEPLVNRDGTRASIQLDRKFGLSVTISIIKR